MSKSKTYRGQRNTYNPCGCFHCSGYDKAYIQKITKQDLDKDMKTQLNELNLI